MFEILKEIMINFFYLYHQNLASLIYFDQQNYLKVSQLIIFI